MKWYDKKGAFGDIAISTRVRLARNLSDLPFPERMTQDQQSLLKSRISEIFITGGNQKNFTLLDIEKLPASQRYSLVERHLISTELADKNGIRGFLLSGDESLSVMINEEDHIRIQALGSGLCPKECLAAAFEADDLLDSALPYAFDDELGYLTRCPTNVGTGLRASVMLHLPALTETGSIQAIAAAAGKLGFAVRGLYGEGSASAGALYQISNQLTLGLSEDEIVSRLIEIVTEISGKEKSLRNRFIDTQRIFIEDRVYRAAAALTFARILNTTEAMSLLSDLRIGLSLDILNNLEYEALNRLISEIQPNTLSLTQSAPDSGTRDILRAKLVRETVAPVLRNTTK